MRSYSDAQLVEAVAGSHSWRGVLRTLGLAGTSGSSMRSVRARAERLGLDYTHFSGRRRWTEARLTEAVASASSWSAVLDSLGLTGGSSSVTIRGHAARLDLNTSHLDRPRHEPRQDIRAAPNLANLRRAGSLMAAAWSRCADSQLRGRLSHAGTT